MKMSPVAFSLWLLTIVTVATTVVQGGCQAEVNFTEVSDLVDNINACAYPTANLNKDCVSDACPLNTYNNFECPWEPAGENLDLYYLNSSLVKFGACISTVAGNALNLYKVCDERWYPIMVPRMGLTTSVGGYALQCYLNAQAPIAFEPPTTFTLTSANTNPFNLLLLNRVQYAPVVKCSINGQLQAQRFAPVYTCDYTTTADVTLTSAASDEPPTVKVTSATKNCTLHVYLADYHYMVDNKVVDKNGKNVTQTAPKALNEKYAYVQGLFQDIVDQANGQMAFATYMATFVAMGMQWLYGGCL